MCQGRGSELVRFVGGVFPHLVAVPWLARRLLQPAPLSLVVGSGCTVYEAGWVGMLVAFASGHGFRIATMQMILKSL